jgi:hypothetical protein
VLQPTAAGVGAGRGGFLGRGQNRVAAHERLWL